MSTVYRRVQGGPTSVIACVDLSATVQKQPDHLLMTFRRSKNQWTASGDRKLSICIEIPIEQGGHRSEVALINGVQEADTTAVQSYRNKDEDERRR